MENENRQAPDLIHDLLKIPTVSFTIPDIEDFLGVSRKRARAVLVYGVQEELIRNAKDHNDEGRDFTLYEKSSWRREWVTKKWGAVGG
jgi:response regulator of citrate/malate metabolism